MKFWKCITFSFGAASLSYSKADVQSNCVKRAMRPLKRTSRGVDFQPIRLPNLLRSPQLHLHCSADVFIAVSTAIISGKSLHFQCLGQPFGYDESPMQGMKAIPFMATL